MIVALLSITGYNYRKFEGEIEMSYNLVIGNKNDPHYDHFISVDVNEAVEYIYDNGIPECIAMGFDENLRITFPWGWGFSITRYTCLA